MDKSLAEVRRRVTAEIYDAFRGVGRVGGYSFEEADTFDGHPNPTEEARAEARSFDTESTWEELVDDADWQDWGSPWFFLDPIGFRYYLPASMIRTMARERDESLKAVLNVDRDEFKEHTLERWSLLDSAQRLAVRHFLSFMEHLASLQGDEADAADWHRIRETWWEVQIS